MAIELPPDSGPDDVRTTHQALKQERPTRLALQTAHRAIVFQVLAVGRRGMSARAFIRTRRTPLQLLSTFHSDSVETRVLRPQGEPVPARVDKHYSAEVEDAWLGPGSEVDRLWLGTLEWTRRLRYELDEDRLREQLRELSLRLEQLQRARAKDVMHATPSPVAADQASRTVIGVSPYSRRTP